jgi:ubiquitin C-terminal hydrolase
MFEQRLAVKDAFTIDLADWVNPINWRDQLPREIAIQRRLHERHGHEHHVHHYYGHRIAFWQRQYRLYNEVCDLGSLMDAMDWYSRK